MFTTLKLGDWNALCEVCGFKYKGSMLKKRWDGLMVCKDDYETRHPQDLIKIPKEDQSVPWTSPEPDDTFITLTYSSVGNQENTVPSGNFTTNNETI
jgi:hypothetical protein